MRDKEKEDIQDEVGFNTIIGLGSSLRGTLMVEGTLRVDGDFDGDLLNCDRLEVGPHGCVRVDVHVREAIVEGQMHGSIQAEDRVELLTGARMYGDLSCRRVVIEDGVHFSGRCTMAEEGEPLPSMGHPSTRPIESTASMEIASGYRREDL
ncbi:MAG: polymer-forming cytoskeletal protein [Candidatus Thorarchaeota archaeon]